MSVFKKAGGRRRTISIYYIIIISGEDKCCGDSGNRIWVLGSVEVVDRLFYFLYGMRGRPLIRLCLRRELKRSNVKSQGSLKEGHSRQWE